MLRQVSRSFALMALCVTASCATTSSSNVAPAERSQLIEQLQEARSTDLNNATDTSLGPVAAGDYMIQAQKAQTAIGKLRAGAHLSKSELSDALFVPPKHISPAEREQLVAQLQASKKLDDAIYREHLGGWDPILTEDCTVQAMRARDAINDLETDQPISWQEIDQAMHVPNEYYW
jgi:ribosome-binding protein aMBF1 (putative translation factor)